MFLIREFPLSPLVEKFKTLEICVLSVILMLCYKAYKSEPVKRREPSARSRRFLNVNFPCPVHVETGFITLLVKQCVPTTRKSA
jgi:hypothetical protein